MTQQRHVGTVLDIFIAPGKGAPMESQEETFVLAHKGLARDRYAEGKGAYSKAGREVIRHVTLIDREAIAEANEELMAIGLEPFEARETRRNLLTDGIDWNQFVGHEVQIGGVALRIVELCTPCRRPENLAGRRGFYDAFQRRGGVRAEALTNSIVRVGDQLVVSGPKE